MAALWQSIILQSSQVTLRKVMGETDKKARVYWGKCVLPRGRLLNVGKNPKRKLGWAGHCRGLLCTGTNTEKGNIIRQLSPKLNNWQKNQIESKLKWLEIAVAKDQIVWVCTVCKNWN